MEYRGIASIRVGLFEVEHHRFLEFLGVPLSDFVNLVHYSNDNSEPLNGFGFLHVVSGGDHTFEWNPVAGSRDMVGRPSARWVYTSSRRADIGSDAFARLIGQSL